MKRIILFITVLVFFSGIFIPPTFAIGSALDSTRDDIQGVGDAVQEAVDEASKTSTIYTGEFFNDSSKYRLEGEGGIISSLLPRVATWMTGLLAAVAVLFLMYAGILFLTAGGEEEKISEATKTAVYVVLGLILAMFGYVLVYLFLTLFNPA